MKCSIKRLMPDGGSRQGYKTREHKSCDISLVQNKLSGWVEVASGDDIMTLNAEVVWMDLYHESSQFDFAIRVNVLIEGNWEFGTLRRELWYVTRTRRPDA